ncbi:MAG: DUF4384 domain-containing protein [Rhizobiales bacterium]|nr:DUF4384 domain-containing protein [Hyphomicrobiales bacterium]
MPSPRFPRPSRIASSARTALAALVFSIPFVGAGTAIAAESDAYPFRIALRGEMTGLALRLNACTGHSSAGEREVLFIGVPPLNIHLDPPDRRALNSAAAAEIGTIKGFRANPIEPAGVLPSLVRGGPNAAIELRDTLAKRYDAPIVVVFDTARPTPDLLQLQINMLGRDASGGYGCTETAVLSLDATTFEPRTRASGEGDFVVLGGALIDAVQRMGKEIAAAGKLTIVGRADLPGECALKRGMGRDVTALVFDMRRQGLALGESTEWPQIRQASGDSPEGVLEGRELEVLAEASPLGDSVLEVTVTLYENGGILDLIRYQAVIPVSRRAGCEPPATSPTVTSAPATTTDTVAETPSVPATGETPAVTTAPAVTELPAATPLAPKPVERADFGFFASQASFRPGDPMALTLVPPVDCRLTLINVDDRGRSCVLLPHPKVEDRLLKAGETFRFPPRGSMRAGDAGTETFIALCNASPGAVATERHVTAEVACSDGSTSPENYEEKTLETVVVDYDAPTPAGEGEIIRRSLRIKIAP